MWTAVAATALSAGLWLMLSAGEARASCVYGYWTDSAGNNRYCPPDCGGNPACGDTGTTYSSPNTGGTYSTPRGQGWFCLAKARSGAWGWGESQSKSRARSLALSACHERASSCWIASCNLGGGSTFRPSQVNRAKRQKARRRAGRRKQMHAYNDRGIRLKDRGKYAEAVRDYKLALKYCAARKDCVVIRDNFRSAKSSLEYQRAAEKRRREREAREAREARERKRIEATRKRLASAVEGGDWKTALADQAVLVEKNKNDPGAWKTFAEYLEKAGRLDDAATALRRAAMLAGGNAAPGISEMYRRDATRRAGNGEYKVAIAQQAMALDLRRDDAGLWQGLGDYMSKDGQLDKAATAYRRAHELGGPDPEDKIFALYQADVLTRAGALKPAGRIKLYRALIKKFPDARANLTRRRLAEELAVQNRAKEADAVLREVARLDPGSAATETGQPGGFEKSHGEQGLGPKAGQQAGDAGEGGKGTDALKVGKPGKDLQTAAHHAGTAKGGSAAGAKAEAMQGFDTAGRRLGGDTDVPAIAGVPIRTGDSPKSAIPEIPKDIGADIPPAKRQKVAEALAGNRMWKKLSTRRKTIETRRAKIAERRKELESELDSPAVAKNAKKKAEIVAEITKSVIEDDKARKELHDVKVGQKTVAETISFDIEIDDEGADDEEAGDEADPKQAGELKPATPN